MIIGLIKEFKTPPDYRVAFSPLQLLALQLRFPGIQFRVQKYSERCFSDDDYASSGIQVVDSLEDCDVIMGIKEVPPEKLISGKTYFFFSHTIKCQPANWGLMKSLLEKNIRMIDYECLRRSTGERILGFGRFAGIVGAYMGIKAIAQLQGIASLPHPEAFSRGLQDCFQSLNQMESTDCRVLLTGTGRVAKGAVESLVNAGFRRCRPEDLKTQRGKVFSQIDFDVYYKRRGGLSFSRSHFLAHPEEYVSILPHFLECVDMLITGHYWDARSPRLLEDEDLAKLMPTLKVIADISCDVGGPISCTIRPSSLGSPYYGYSPELKAETLAFTEGSITVMAVDNLPCALPKDASLAFGSALEQVIDCLYFGVNHPVLYSATLCEGGNSTPQYSYLESWAMRHNA